MQSISRGQSYKSYWVASNGSIAFVDAPLKELAKVETDSDLEEFMVVENTLIGQDSKWAGINLDTDAEWGCLKHAHNHSDIDIQHHEKKTAPIHDALQDNSDDEDNGEMIGECENCGQRIYESYDFGLMILL